MDEPGNSPTRSTPAPTLSQPKPQPKIIRVLTVMAYMLSVSMAAILLSIYYIFVWNGGGSNTVQPQPLAAPLMSLRSDYNNSETITMGGDSTTVGVVVGGENLNVMGVFTTTTEELLAYSTGAETTEDGITIEGLHVGVVT